MIIMISKIGVIRIEIPKYKILVPIQYQIQLLLQHLKRQMQHIRILGTTEQSRLLHSTKQIFTLEKR